MSRTKLIVIAVIAVFAVLLGLLTIKALGNERRGLFSRDDYDADVRAALETLEAWNGTLVVPLDAKSGRYVFSTDYNGDRIVPSRLVAEYPDEIGAILRYELSERDGSTYHTGSGETVQGMQRVLTITFIDADGAELLQNRFFAKMPDKAEIPENVASFLQPFSEAELANIHFWIELSMTDLLGYTVEE